MKNNLILSRRIIAGICFVLILCSFNLIVSTTDILAIDNNNERVATITTLTPHDPISITSDSGLEVFPGSGTEIEPYIIEGYNITTTASTGIYITETTKHFIIRNCYVNAAEFSIFIENVAEGTATIMNNLCTNSEEYCVFLLSSSGSILTNNTCTKNGCGILLWLSSNTTLTNNTCSANVCGIYLLDSSDSTLTNNTCNNNSWGGVILEESINVTLANNTCINNTVGIELHDSPWTTIINNNFYNDGLSIHEYCVEAYLTHAIENNWVNEKPLGFYINLDNPTFSEPLYGQLFLINCTDAIVSNQELSNVQTGLTIHWCDNIILTNNTCTNNHDTGISLRSSPGATLTNNTCTRNYYGIFLSYSSGSTLTNNTFNNNSWGGIHMSRSNNSILTNNTFHNSGLYIRELSVEEYLTYVVENNWVNEKPLGFYSNLDQPTFSEPLFGQLFLISCTEAIVSNQELSNTTTGLNILWCDDILLTNNTCNNNNYVGISLEYSSSASLTENTCDYNSWNGIYLSYSSGSTLTDNTCINASIGIYLFLSGFSTITNNTCNYNSWNGIDLYSSDFSTLTDNTCNNNLQGIFSSSSNCLITYNLLQENEEYGISLFFDAYDNTVHHNTFVDNNLGGTSQACDDGGTNNKWYDPSTNEGNYWSDWSGIGSYPIDGYASSEDPYPLDEEGNPPVIPEFAHRSILTVIITIFPCLLLVHFLSKKRRKNS